MWRSPGHPQHFNFALEVLQIESQKFKLKKTKTKKLKTPDKAKQQKHIKVIAEKAVEKFSFVPNWRSLSEQYNTQFNNWVGMNKTERHNRNLKSFFNTLVTYIQFGTKKIATQLFCSVFKSKHVHNTPLYHGDRVRKSKELQI